MTIHSEKYLSYLRSPEWKRKRQTFLAAANCTCQHCGKSDMDMLQVHHLNYDRLGAEMDKDVMVVCTPCHSELDIVRRRHTDAEQYERRLDGWATKVYGEYWHDYPSEVIEDEFESWLDRHEYD